MKNALVVVGVIIVVLVLVYLFRRESFQALSLKRLRKMGSGILPEVSVREVIIDETDLPSALVDLVRMYDFDSMVVNLLKQRIIEKNNFDYYTTEAVTSLLKEYAKSLVQSNPSSFLEDQLNFAPSAHPKSADKIAQQDITGFLKMNVNQWLDPLVDFTKDVITEKRINGYIKELEENPDADLQYDFKLFLEFFIRQTIKEDQPELLYEIVKTNLISAVNQMKRLPSKYGEILPMTEEILNQVVNLSLEDDNSEIYSEIARQIYAMYRSVR
jgi:hypothetical protein